MAAKDSDKRQMGLVVTIGVNRLDPRHYGKVAPLKFCDADAAEMRRIAVNSGFVSHAHLLDEHATRDAVKNALRGARGRIAPGGIFMLSFAGHGAQVPDERETGEVDGKDETWCLFDAELIDDEIFHELALFPEGVRIIMFSDSCHSGSVTRAADFVKSLPEGRLQELENMFRELERTRGGANNIAIRSLRPSEAIRTYIANKAFYDELNSQGGSEATSALKARALSLTACADGEVTIEARGSGVFTGTVSDVWGDGKFQGNYDVFRHEVQQILRRFQSVAYHLWKDYDPPLQSQRPFTVTTSP